MAVEISTATGPMDLFAKLRTFLTKDGELQAFGQAWTLREDSPAKFIVRSYWGQTCTVDVAVELTGTRLQATVNNERDLSYWVCLPAGDMPYLFVSNGRYFTFTCGDGAARPAMTCGLYRQFRHPEDHKQPFVCGGSSRDNLPATSSFIEPDHSISVVTRKGKAVSPTNDIRAKFLRDNPPEVGGNIPVLPMLVSLSGEVEDPIGALDGVYHIPYLDYTTSYDLAADRINLCAERIRVCSTLAPWQVATLPDIGPFLPMPKNESVHLGDTISIPGRKLRVEQVLDRPDSRWAVNLDKREPDVTCVSPFETPYITDGVSRLNNILPLFG